MMRGLQFIDNIVVIGQAYSSCMLYISFQKIENNFVGQNINPRLDYWLNLYTLGIFVLNTIYMSKHLWK